MHTEEGTFINAPAVDPLRYAGFWPRLGALLLDNLIFLAVASLEFCKRPAVGLIA
jgi:hypothetical protein